MSVNGRDVELPDEVSDFCAFAREATADQIVAILARVAALALRAGCSQKEAELAVSDITLQVMAMRDKLMVN